MSAKAIRHSKPMAHSIRVMHTLVTFCNVSKYLWLRSLTHVWPSCVWTSLPFGWEQTFPPTGQALILTPGPLTPLPASEPDLISGPKPRPRWAADRHFKVVTSDSLSDSPPMATVSYVRVSFKSLKRITGQRKTAASGLLTFGFYSDCELYWQICVVVMGAWPIEFMPVFVFFNLPFLCFMCIF